MTTVTEFLDYYASVRRRTRRVADCIPADQIEWVPRPGAFTPGDLVRHIAATERWMFVETVCGRPSRYASHGRELADGKDEVLAFMDRLHAESIAQLQTLTPEALQRPAETPAGTKLAAWKWLRAMIEHEVHHRGQLYTLLGMLGVETPPLYGLTSEEVRRRSASLSH